MSIETDPLSSVQTIETDRLILRDFRETDASDVFEYSRNPRIGLDAGWPPHTSIDDSLFFIREIASRDYVWAIIPKETLTNEKPSGIVIGSIGLIADPARSFERSLMLGYAIGSDWWNRGFVSEASNCVIRFGFESIGLSLISCTCYPWNAASKRVIDKSGFTFEGVRRQAEIGQDGRVEDFLCHSMTKEEWEKATQAE